MRLCFPPALKRLRQSRDIEDDIEEMRMEEIAQKNEAQMNVCQIFRCPSLRLPLVIAVIMQLSQQLSGINAVRFITLNRLCILNVSYINIFS